METRTTSGLKACVTRRSFSRTSLFSLLAAAASSFEEQAFAGQGEPGSSTRRDVIKQRLPGEPQREITLVEVVYPPGAGSPPHLYPNGVTAFVVASSIVSKVGDETERTFRAGEARWEPPGAFHRVLRNASTSEPARLLAIYIAPSEARDNDLMQPI